MAHETVLAGDAMSTGDLRAAGAVLADGIRFVAAPTGYSTWWLVLAVVFAVLVALWCAVAVVWTMPVATLRKIPVLRDITKKVLRRRFAVAIDRVERRYATGQLTPREAHHRLARTLRTYLHFQTGQWTQVMGLSDIDVSELKPAAGALAFVSDGQFSAAGNSDFRRAVVMVREVVTSWN